MKPAASREISGVIGGPAPVELPEGREPTATPRPWIVGAIVVVGLGLLAPVLLNEHARSIPADFAGDTSERRGADGAPDASEADGASTPTAGGCDAPRKPRVKLSGEIDEDATLTCDRDYLLSFNTRVAPGVTLTIEPGTTIYGEHETKGALIIQPGARLIAEGTAARPIVFTSNQPEAARKPGDWGGVIILGRAPINLRDADGHAMLGEVEGVTGVARYGGDDPEDDSGVLRYVRIEYPGVELAPANEINGLTLAGVGRGTQIDHVQVLASIDDCFEFFGGTVDATHLVCDAPGDDAFDFDHGYQGRLQFLVARNRQLDTPSDAKTGHALEIDNDPNGTIAEPRTSPAVWNATLCGVSGGKTTSHAIVARRASRAKLHSLVIGGFDYALDLRDASTELELRGVGLADQRPAELDELDDDAGFDELAWFAEPARAMTRDIAGFSCDADELIPAAPIPGPPGSRGRPRMVFAPTSWLGAFAGPEDDWTAGWVSWVPRS